VELVFGAGVDGAGLGAGVLGALEGSVLDFVSEAASDFFSAGADSPLEELLFDA
jgi:hypothetical protein